MSRVSHDVDILARVCIIPLNVCCKHRSKNERRMKERERAHNLPSQTRLSYYCLLCARTVADLRKEREKKTITQNLTLEHRPSRARFTPRALSQIPPPPPMLLLLEASFRVCDLAPSFRSLLFSTVL
uniref:Uncharacterized protein n=1 Tax=Trichogramma kaykai TaxID=54128 RepID=A0ABD2W6N5_9HYME